MEKLDIPEKQPYEGKATQKQKQKIWELGCSDEKIIDELGKQQASWLIDNLIEAQRKRGALNENFQQIKIWGITFVVSVVVYAGGSSWVNDDSPYKGLLSLVFIVSLISFFKTVKYGFGWLKNKLFK